MNFIRLKVFIFFFLSSTSLIAQEKVMKRELQVESENDSYTSLTRDRYYSNGIYIRYRVLANFAKWSPNVSKVIRSYHLNHRVFSPKHLFWHDVNDMDRPYAGQISLSVSNEYYLNDQSYINAKLEAGWMGPFLRTGQLQYDWHKAFGFSLPQGWRYQINDGPVVNLWGTYAKKLCGNQELDLTTESNVAIGTVFIHARQEFMLRMGNFKEIHQSAQYNGLVGNRKNGSGNQEIYFFLSPGLEYVPYNGTIEGNFAGKKSIYTEETVPWVFQIRTGIVASWTKFNVALLYYRRTRETTESTFHKFLGIRLNQRF